MNINELMNINDVRESATIFPRPCKLTLDLLTLKVVSELRVTWATCVPILVFLGLFVLELFQMYVTARQTDVRQKHRLMSPSGGIMKKALRGDANTALAVVRRTHKQKHRQGRLQYTAQLSAQCNNNNSLGSNRLLYRPTES